MINRSLLFTASAVAFSSCTIVGPQYQRPTLPLTEQFALTTDALTIAAEDRWWTQFNDPLLVSFIDMTLARNIQIEAARARIDEARAILRTTGRRSQLGGGVSATVSAQGVDGVTNGTSQAQITASYVLDLFGQRRRQEEQAEALLEATVQDEATLRLALQAEVTQAYLTARFLQASLHIRQRTVANRNRLVSILRERIEAGDATEVELRRAQAELRLEQAQLPELTGDFQATAFALATLLVEPAENVLDALNKRHPQPEPPGRLNPDVPASLLRNRPDIRASEARLVAATAEIGVLEAQLYPSLSLGGTIGSSAADTVSFGPSLIVPVFDIPIRRANVEAGRARAREAEAVYRQTVLEAVEEVQVNLAQAQSLERQRKALLRALAAYRDAVALSQEAFSLNAVTLADVISAEDDLRDTSLTLAAVRRDSAAAWAQLNIAIGQGRDVTGPASAP